MDGSTFDFNFCGGVWCLAVVDIILDAAAGDADDVAAGDVATGDVGVPQLRFSLARLRLLLLPELLPLAEAGSVTDIGGVVSCRFRISWTICCRWRFDTGRLFGDCGVCFCWCFRFLGGVSCPVGSLSFFFWSIHRSIFFRHPRSYRVHHHWMLLLSWSRHCHCCLWLLLLSIIIFHFLVSVVLLFAVLLLRCIIIIIIIIILVMPAEVQWNESSVSSMMLSPEVRSNLYYY